MGQEYKDVNLNGRDFRLSKLSAKMGDYIITQMGLKRYGEFDVYSRIQEALLDTVSCYHDANGQRVAVRIHNSADPRKWVDPACNLEYDLDTMTAVCEAALDFNLGAFFRKKKEEADKMGEGQQGLPN